MVLGLYNIVIEKRKGEKIILETIALFAATAGDGAHIEPVRASVLIA